MHGKASSSSRAWCCSSDSSCSKCMLFVACESLGAGTSGTCNSECLSRPKLSHKKDVTPRKLRGVPFSPSLQEPALASCLGPVWRCRGFSYSEPCLHLAYKKCGRSDAMMWCGLRCCFWRSAMKRKGKISTGASCVSRFRA